MLLLLLLGMLLLLRHQLLLEQPEPLELALLSDLLVLLPLKTLKMRLLKHLVTLEVEPRLECLVMKLEKLRVMVAQLLHG
jgi:hypothetical protein